MINALRKIRAQQRQKRFYAQMIQADDLCFDIGANHGKRTRIFTELGAHVVSVEPVKDSFNVLKDTFGQHPRVTLVQKAVGAQQGTTEIHIANISDVCTLSNDFIREYGNQPNHPIEWNNTQPIELTNLDALIEQYGVPTFIKIDVEGFEPEVLKGLHSPISCMSFEYNARLKSHAINCIQRLNEIATCYFNFSKYESFQWEFNAWQSSEDIQHYIHHLPPEIATGDIYVRMK